MRTRNPSRGRIGNGTLLAGILAGLLGIGGGIVIVPMLVFCFVRQGIPDAIIMHLALGKRARGMQLSYISELVREYSQLVVMGDFNCGFESRELRELVDNTHLKLPVEDLKTFPSWRPNRKFDHILISESLTLRKTHVLEHTHSDHLPICVEIGLPKGVHLVS